MKTDEEQAKEYAEKEFPVKTDRTINYGNEVKHYPFIVGFKIGRELSDEKALRFAEFTSHNCDLWTTNPTTYKLLDEDACAIGEPIGEKQLYASKEFEQYLNGLKK
jgi:hypothetical protein